MGEIDAPSERCNLLEWTTEELKLNLGSFIYTQHSNCL